METRRRRQRLYVWLLPALWCPGALVGYYHPGDEYGLWAVSTLAGTWALMALSAAGIGIGDIHNPLLPGTVLAVGGLVLAGLGYVMDRRRVNRWMWGLLYLGLAVALLMWAVGSYPSIERALRKNGSWTAYIVASSNAGLTLSTVLSLGLALLYRPRHDSEEEK